MSKLKKMTNHSVFFPLNFILKKLSTGTIKKNKKAIKKIKSPYLWGFYNYF